MPIINEKQAKQFLSQINPSDKVAIIHHDDGDGFCSGILLQNFCETKKAKIKSFTFNNKDSTLKKLRLKNFNKIIITDIPAEIIKPEIELIKDKQVLYLDHHKEIQLPEQILYYPTVSQGYIPSSRTTYELTGGKLFIALIGTISDSGNLYKENDNFIKKSLKELNLNLKEFQEKYSHLFCDIIIYFNKSPNKLFKKLSKISSLKELSKFQKYADKIEKEIKKQIIKAKQNKKTFGRIDVYQIDPKYPIKGIIAAILSRENPDQVNLQLASQNKKFIGISARDQSPKANLPELLKTLTQNLSYAKVGGHPRASGGQILKSELPKFLQNIRSLP